MDYDFLLKAFRASNVVYVDRTFGNYRMYGDNKTSRAFSTNDGWEMLASVSQKHVAKQNVLYRLHVLLGIALLRQTLGVSGTPSLPFRLKRRAMLVCQNVLDRIVASFERSTDRATSR